MRGAQELMRLFVALALVHAATAHMSVESAAWEVRPLTDADELLQISGMAANDPIQAKLASDAESAHSAKLEVEKNAQTAEAKFKAADASAQAATKQALETASPDDADAAVTAKQEAATAKEQHTKVQGELSVAQQKANDALKKAQDAGAIVNLPSTAPAPAPLPAAAVPGPVPAVTPAPAPAAQPLPPLQPQPPSKLETIMKERRMQRLKAEAHDLKTKYEEAKVEKQEADFVLTKAMAKLTKLQTKLAESKSAKAAAHKEQEETDKKILKAHVDEHMAAHELSEVKHSAKLAESMVDEAKVEEEVASSLADTGGGDEDLEKADMKREEVDERLKNAKAEVVALKMNAEKTKAATEAAQTALQEKQTAIEELHQLLRKADQRFASAKYDIRQEQNDEIVLVEDKDQAKAQEKIASKRLNTAHGLAKAAAMKLNAAENADEEYMKALLLDPEEAKKEAVARVKDQDGISKDGNPLVAPAGSVEQAYIQRFNEMPLPDNGRNPILEAEARAQLKDDKEQDATAAATNPGPAETAAAASTGVMPTL